MKIPIWQKDFTADELNCSIPFDTGRRLQGDNGSELFDEISSIIGATENRVRSRKEADQRQHDATVEALLANLLVAALNRVEPDRFVAVPFNTSTYSGSGLSVVSMRLARDALGNEGLLEGTRGYNRQHYMPGQEHARLTRIRATPALREIFDRCLVDRRTAKCSCKHVIKITKANNNLDFKHPAEIAASALVLQSVNVRIGGAALELPDEAWARIGAARKKKVKGEPDEEPYSGDLTAISLYRSFKGNWGQGGRLYGGWWMNIPKAERRLITIDGEATAELDYSQLHPTLLFAREGLRLTYDPYAFAGFSGDTFRDMGKRTFGRLINRWKAGKHPWQGSRFQSGNALDGDAKPLRLQASKEDKSALPPGMSFQQYLGLLQSHLAPIAKWFGSDAGMTLQREDSDLAVSILQRLDQAGIVSLPVHDSFIVKQSEVTTLRQIMTECFFDRYRFNPVIKSPGG